MGIWGWIVFHLVVLALLAIDLGVFKRKTGVVTPLQAALWSAFWVTLSLLFNAFIYYQMGSVKAGEFLSAYLLEKSLSVDNLFVFALLFGYFKVPDENQHRILFFGILGALVLRASLIGVGLVLVDQFEWVTYIFGAFLVYTGVRMAIGGDPEVKTETNPIIRFMRGVIPLTTEYHGQKFFVRPEGRLTATPMLVVLAMIETTDLVFALDSIPATIAVVASKDMFIAYTANICAILGLRALYFLLANMMHKFHLLKYGLAVVLAYIGVKMLIHIFHVHIDTTVSLLVIAAVLGVAIGASLLLPDNKKSRKA